MKRNSFVFYASYKEALDNLQPQQQLNLYKAICEYAFNGKFIRLTKQEKSILNLIIPTLDSSMRRYDANVENGKKGGRPKRENAPLQNPTETQQKPNQNPNITQSKPNTKPKQNLNDNYNYNVNDNYNINKQDKTKQVNRIEEKNNLIDDVVQSSPDKKIYFLDVVNEKIKKLSDNNIEDIQIINRLKSLIEQISKSSSCVVNGQQTEIATILETLVDLFIGTDNEIIERITNIFEKIDNAENVFNKFKYSVGVLYNQAKQVVSQC